MIKWIFIIVAANALIDGALAVACLTSGRKTDGRICNERSRK